MFKSKKNRDSVLLAFMALIVILFVLYIIFPQEKKTLKEEVPVTLQGKNGIKDIKSGPGKNEYAGDHNELLRKELRTIFNMVSSAEKGINLISVKEINSVFVLLKENTEGCPVDKLLRYSFRDLGQIATTDCGGKTSNFNKFDIYIALFLVRLNRENIIDRSVNNTIAEINELVNLNPYQLINNEIEEDYQLLPLMIFTSLIVNKLDIFGIPETSIEFLSALGNIKDLTKSQHLNLIKDLLRYSKGIKKYEINWIEHDVIGPDDKGFFKNVVTETHSFFKHNFLTFPDNSRPDSNIWIRKLTDADNGSIELNDLKIVEETLGERLSARSILYSPNISKFIVIMNSPAPKIEGAFILKLYRDKMDEVYRNYTSVIFSEKISAEKEFIEKLLKFGKYLYKNRSLF